MRLDKFLTECNIGTRSQVKALIKQGIVSVNGIPTTKPDTPLNPEKDSVTFQGNTLEYHHYEYFMLNKPAGVLSATKDPNAPTVMDLLPKDHCRDLFPVGRLDKDTEGLLILTNDGDLAHRLLSPKKHVFKTYHCKLRHPLTNRDILALENGISLGEDGVTGKAFVSLCPDGEDGTSRIHLSIGEGKYHQVKRMLEAVNNEVLYLERVRFGCLSLDPDLPRGECRRLQPQEIALLNASAEIQREKKALLREKKAVIFDVDGTLVDSMWMWADIDREYLGRFGIPLENPAELQSKIEGMSFDETARYFKEFYPIEDSVEKMKSDWNAMAFEKYRREVPLKKGIFEFLQGCKRRQIRLGIATSNSRELLEVILKAHHLENIFDYIVTGSDQLKGKPAPDMYLAAAEGLSVDPADCLVFEDILPGLRAGREAGMTVCAVEDAYSAETRPEKKAFADYYIDDFFDFF